jgi:hypothetical protein
VVPDHEDLGCLVERRDGKLLLLGDESYWGWDELVADSDCCLRVEILEDDADLTVEANE